MKIKYLILSAVVALFATNTAKAQDNHQGRGCGTTEYHQSQLNADPTLATRMDDIEHFTNTFIANGGGQEKAVITIPVVFHVVYRTSAENISDARILAQLNQLNLDFARLNSDAGNTPAAFQGLAANTQIQFCLAQRDPNGAATTGIVRRATTVTSFSSNNAVKYTSQGGSNAWDATKYLNIWVCNLGSGLLGYAQFPGGSAATDGVVVLNTSVGSLTTPGTATNYNYGRTATHEVGHWLNLRHIWGDATCGNDLVSDTPTQQTSNSGCPAFPRVTCSNGPNGDMFMNYMDYTYDACMNMFTTGQATRMNALFATGGARASLLNSQGCVPVGQVSCGTPTGLAASGITTTGATLSWAAVSGASSYNVQIRPTGTTTWTTLSATTNSLAVSGLTLATSYEFQVQANCNGTLGSYSATATFTTASAQVSCGTPSGLASSNITTSTASLSWTAVSGATSYNVQFRLTGATTWTTGTVTNASASLSGLAAGSSYQWQVQANCNGTLSAYSATATFTTTANTTCTDVYESNETRQTSKAITTNTNISARIGSTTDKDWFRFTTTTAARNIKVTLDQLPADYDVRLYNSNGSQLAISQNSGTASETITRNTSSTGTYYLQVYGYNGANSTACYRLRVDVSSSSFKTIDGGEFEEVELEPADALSLFPNPTTGSFTIQLLSDNENDATVRVFDITGKAVVNTRFGATKGQNLFNVDLSGQAQGIYFVEVKQGATRLIKKLIVQ